MRARARLALVSASPSIMATMSAVVASIRRHRVDEPAVPDDGRGFGDLADLVHAVADVDDRDARAAIDRTASRTCSTSRGRQRAGRLVEDQEPWVARSPRGRSRPSAARRATACRPRRRASMSRPRASSTCGGLGGASGVVELRRRARGQAPRNRFSATLISGDQAELLVDRPHAQLGGAAAPPPSSGPPPIGPRRCRRSRRRSGGGSASTCRRRSCRAARGPRPARWRAWRHRGPPRRRSSSRRPRRESMPSSRDWSVSHQEILPGACRWARADPRPSRNAGGVCEPASGDRRRGRGRHRRGRR